MDHTPAILETKILSDRKYTLKEISFRLNAGPAAGQDQQREVYERKNSAVILLYHPQQKTILLTRQFRLPTYLNGNADGMMTECCAGIMEEGESPEDCILREALEETGYAIGEVEKVFEAYMSPGSVTELIHFFIAVYNQEMKAGAGGGLAAEQEHIEVMELPFEEAYAMIASGDQKDAKTIILLQYMKLRQQL